ncbi:MAG: acylneuraminate cytidylyltransferase family protein [Blastococcus sp.]
MAPHVLAVVPARGGSKGLPGKNIRPLAGVPLLVHSLRAAALTPGVTRCIVSTDSEEIADVARRHGGDVPFLRPADLAGDTTPTGPVLAHALAAVEAEDGRSYDAVLLLEPTSPCRSPERMGEAIAQLLSDDSVDGVVSISEPTFNPTAVGVRREPDGTVRRYAPEAAGMTRRQEAAPFLRLNGNFYVWKSDFIRRLQHSWLDEGVHRGYEIPEKEAFSVDDEYEFELIEALVRAEFITLPS